MAVFQKIRSLFGSSDESESQEFAPAPPTTYAIHALTETHLKEVMRLNLRCFRRGENYTKHTFSYLLNDPTTLSYRVVTAESEIVGFVFVMTGDGTGHITTIGVAPEHRRRNIAKTLIEKAENALLLRGFTTVSLEVRISNIVAQNLYSGLGYSIVQRLAKYYNNGEDAFMMVKPLQRTAPKLT